MLNLEEKEWKDFIVGELFNVLNSKPYHKKDLRIIDNSNSYIPYISRTNKNNGVEEIVFKEDSFRINNKNTIAFGAENATFFLQPFKYITGNKMYIIDNQNINKLNGLFIQQTLNTSIRDCGFSYGQGLTGTRAKRRNVLLPINKELKPDFEYMENYTKSIMDKKIQNYKRYANNQLEKIVFKEIPKISEVEFKSFELNKIFSKLQQGKSKGLNHLNISEKGEINYLGAKKSNNGVLAYVEENNESKKIIQAGNCIAFIRNGNGSAGYSIYKAEPFIATSDITVGYSKNLNKYIGLFITTLSDKMRGKYSFGYKRSDSRLKKEKLLLPVNSNGEPDYEYMEQYMKNIIYIKINRYLNYLENK